MILRGCSPRLKPSNGRLNLGQVGLIVSKAGVTQQGESLSFK